MCERKTSAAPLAVVVAGGVVAAAAAIAAAAAAIAAVLAAADLVLVAWLVAVLRTGPRTWRPAAAVKAPARVAVEARTAPLAIEAPARVVYQITDVQESPVER